MFAALGLALSFLVLLPAASYACSCVQLDTAQHVNHADVVVRGTIDSREESLLSKIRGNPDEVTYPVTVTGVYKGSAGRTIEVHSAGSGASCGLEFIRYGEEYVVFAGTGEDGESGGQLWASLCGGTAEATPALTEEVEALTGPPSAPDGDAAPVGQDRPLWPWAFGLVAAGAGIGILRRRRSG